MDRGTWKNGVEAGWSDWQQLEAYAEVVVTMLTSYSSTSVGTGIDLSEPPEPN